MTPTYSTLALRSPHISVSPTIPGRGTLSRGVFIFCLQTMRTQNIQLQNADCSHCRWISMPEAMRLEKEHAAFRVSRLKAKKTIYRLAWYPEASDSPESPAHITLGDTYRVAGLLPVNDIQRERLIGLNLIPVPPELLAAECSV